MTPRWDPVQWDLIPGVKLFETKNVMTGYGRLVEIYREDWGLDDEPVRQVFQSTLNPGEGSAWHAHGDARDRLFVNSGAMRIILYHSPSRVVNVFTLGEHRPGLVIIPKGVWHGILNVGPTESSVINLVSHEYDTQNPITGSCRPTPTRFTATPSGISCAHTCHRGRRFGPSSSSASSIHAGWPQ